MSSIAASVIIPVWNGREYLPTCLDALLTQELPGFEVILVDDASTDGSADFVAENYPQVRLVRNRQNMGFASTCNAGIVVAQGEVLVLLNQDTRVYPGWLYTLVSALREPQVGVAGCKILYPDGRTIQHAGGWLKWPLAMAHHYGQGELDEGQWDAPRLVDYVTGAAMAFRRDVLDIVGPLDKSFWPGYYEDVDFCSAVREAGYEVWYIPDAVLVHEESASWADAAAIPRAFHRGRLRYLLKHMPPQRFLEEFVPAEQHSHLHVPQGQAGHMLQMAYLEAIPEVARLLPRRWRASAGTIDQVLTALQHLYLSPALESELFDPVLQEFEFRSAVPVLGPAIARLRSLWYGVAAQWAMRHLRQQQEEINRRQKATNQQQTEMNRLYVRSLVSLSREVAYTILRLGSEEEQRTVQDIREE